MKVKKEQKKIYFFRARRMDEVYLPRFVWPAVKKSFLASSFKLTSVLLVTAMLAVTFGNVGYTVSYFSDNDASRSNIFSASLLDFLVSPEGIMEVYIGPEAGGGATFIPIVSPISGSNMQYRVFVEEVAGNPVFCGAIQAEATTTPFIYSGQLISLNAGPTVETDAWTLALSMTSVPTGVNQDDVCYIDLVYRGWKEGFLEGEGYSDEEKIHLKLTARTIVLNEFLPNPEGIAYDFDFGNDYSDGPQGEWVELYNNGPAPVDLAGWYILDAAANKIPITIFNTQFGSTIIPAGGWLVVYMNDAILNNGGDVVKLYNSSDFLVDSYAYANHEVCSYEPTPGEKNELSGTIGSCNPVPPNKSYARIPDGLGAWYDPIPTPGIRNTLAVERDPELTLILSNISVEEATSTIADSGETATTTNETVEPVVSGGGGVVAEDPPAVDLSEQEQATSSPSGQATSTATTTPELISEDFASTTEPIAEIEEMESSTTTEPVIENVDISTTTATTTPEIVEDVGTTTPETVDENTEEQVSEELNETEAVKTEEPAEEAILPEPEPEPLSEPEPESAVTFEEIVADKPEPVTE